MKKDIPFLPVEGIKIAITRQKNELNEFVWNVYMLNDNDYPLKDILIVSKGYGTKGEEEQMTSTLRYHIPLVGPHNFTLVEPIDPSVFHLYNEYWVSYFIGNQIYDKKFIFVPESIIEANLTFIPQLSLEGVVHI